MALFPAEATRVGTGVKQGAATWIERLARLGFAARGIVYTAVGVIAGQAAFRAGTRVTDTEGAMATLVRQPLGQVLLGVIALGLIGYALWMLVQALLDPERVGSDLKGIARRIGFAGVAVIHAGLAIAAIRLLLPGGESGEVAGGDENAVTWTALLMSQPYGRWLVGAVGAGIAIFGLHQLHCAYTIKLGERLNLSRLGSRTREWFIRLGRLGLAARGVVFGVIGWLLIQAARRFDPSEAVGLGGALETLAEQAYGPWLLGGVAVGLIGYGLLELIKAHYRRIQPV